MAIITEAELVEFEKSGMIPRRDGSGNITAWKGPWLPHWYDNYMEALRENQNEKRIQDHKKMGLNAQAQTKEQEKAFEQKKIETAKMKEKARYGAEIAMQNK